VSTQKTHNLKIGYVKEPIKVNLREKPKEI
jgi:hypothetical protein